jgi:hypothetical protein
MKEESMATNLNKLYPSSLYGWSDWRNPRRLSYKINRLCWDSNRRPSEHNRCIGITTFRSWVVTHGTVILKLAYQRKLSPWLVMFRRFRKLMWEEAIRCMTRGLPAKAVTTGTTVSLATGNTMVSEHILQPQFHAFVPAVPGFETRLFAGCLHIGVSWCTSIIVAKMFTSDPLCQ